MSQSQNIADEFLQAYYKIVDSQPGNVINFYQDVSTMSFQGENLNGKNAIAQKLSSLGVPPNSPRRITSKDAQDSCVGSGAIVVFVCGEWVGQQYQEVFQLVPANNSYYIHNCIFRLTAGGGNTFNVPPEAVDLTKGFISHYYTQYDASIESRRGLQSLYVPNSLYSMEGNAFQGPEQIINKMGELPLVQHDPNMLCDVQLVNGLDIVIFFLTGQQSIEGSNPMRFAQFFQIMKQGGSYVIGNQIFRLNYG